MVDHDINRLVLLADNDESAIKLYGDMLSEYEYEVMTAKDGLAAWQLFQEHRPLVVITDMHMPEMNGEELFDEILALEPRTKVIFITGWADVASATRLVKAGAFDYLDKPVSLVHLVGVIKNAFMAVADGVERGECGSAVDGRSGSDGVVAVAGAAGAGAAGAGAAGAAGLTARLRTAGRGDLLQPAALQVDALSAVERLRLDLNNLLQRSIALANEGLPGTVSAEDAATAEGASPAGGVVRRAATASGKDTSAGSGRETTTRQSSIWHETMDMVVSRLEQAAIHLAEVVSLTQHGGKKKADESASPRGDRTS